MPHSKFQAILLAGGQSKRFNTTLNKMATPLCGRPMIYFPLEALATFGIPTTVVINKNSDYLKAIVADYQVGHIDFVYQERALGTGDALRATEACWERDYVIVMNGDNPCISSDIIGKLISEHQIKSADVSFISTVVTNPQSYGRVIRENNKLAIVEDRDCTPDEKLINEVNAGIYIFSTTFLRTNIHKLTSQNQAGELYITDLIKIAQQEEKTIALIQAPFAKVRGVNTLEELWEAEQSKRVELVKHWMQQGVRFEMAHNIHIDVDVVIGENSFIGNGVILTRGSVIGSNCTIEAFSIVANTSIGDGSIIYSHTVVQDSKIGTLCKVGPFVRIKNKSIVGDGAVIEDFAVLSNGVALYPFLEKEQKKPSRLLHTEL